MNRIFSSRNIRIVVIAFSLYGVFCFGKGIFYFFFPKPEVTVPVAMMEEFDRSFYKLNNNLRSQNDLIDFAIIERLSRDKGKAESWKLKSDTLNMVTDSLISKIENYKNLLIEKGGGWGKVNGIVPPSEKFSPTNSNYLTNKLDEKACSKIMLENKGTEKIFQEIKNSELKILGLIDYPYEKEKFEKLIPIPLSSQFESGSIIWRKNNFNSLSLISGITFLEKLFTDVRSFEYQVKDYFYNKTFSSDGPLQHIIARAFSNKNIIHAGEVFQSEIFLTSNYIDGIPKIFIGKLKQEKKDWEENSEFFPLTESPIISGKEIEVVNGVGKFFELNNTIGIHKYSGAIELIFREGIPEFFPFEAEYEVIK